MAIALLLLPFLVYDKILKELNLYERCTLATVSKRTRRIVKGSLRKESFKLHINDDDTYKIAPAVGNHLALHLYDALRCGLKNSMVLKQVLIPREDLGKSPKEIKNKYRDWNELAIKLTQYLVDTFPNLTVTLSFQECQGRFQSLLEVIRKANLQIDHMLVRCETQKETLEILSNCGTVKSLHIEGHIDNRHVSLPPLQCDEVIFGGTGFCAELIVQVFMNCKQLITSPYLRRLNASEVVLIFETWMNNSRLEYMELNFSSTYDTVIKKLEGEPKKFKLGERAHDCYLIRQLNGKEAVIYMENVVLKGYRDAEVITLRTDFELVEGE